MYSEVHQDFLYYRIAPAGANKRHDRIYDYIETVPYTLNGVEQGKLTIRAHGNLAPSRLSGLEEWTFRPKSYPHFDSFISEKDARELVSSPTRVAAHTFYPFMLYQQRWTRFADKGEAGRAKERPIRYAARADAYIFSYYRYILASRYEARLSELGLGDSVLAYRRIKEKDGSGKCNIHFALEAVQAVRTQGNCCAIALDISSFFESLDHEILRQQWCGLLGCVKLPADHFAVFKAITAYSVVDRDQLLERLGFRGDKYLSKSGQPIKGYLVERNRVPRRLCVGSEFRQKIAGGDGQASLIKKNRKPYGIPQGSPISDLLANFYLLGFDAELKARVTALGGTYFRYSDDILIVAPISAEAARDLEEWVRQLITRYGPRLRIKAEKSAIFQYAPDTRGSGNQSWNRVVGEQGKNGLEYLGFRYDGRKMYLRDSTISGLHRKASRSARMLAISLLKRYPEKSAERIMKDFNLTGFLQRYGRVSNFETKSDDIRNWTFWTYANRAARITSPLGLPIFRQLRNFRLLMKQHVQRALEKRVALYNVRLPPG